MVSGLVVTHGRLAVELVRAAKTIVGDSERLQAVALEWDGEASAARAAIRESLQRADQGDGVLILTDMFGGTPTNLSLPLLEPGRIEIVTGVNLPMLVKFLNLAPETTLRVAAEEVQSKGQQAIHIASRVLGRAAAGGEEE